MFLEHTAVVTCLYWYET